jgi:lysyl-tRNA synthetase class 2
MEGIDKLRGVRIEKMGELVSAGVHPYPYRYEVTHHVSDVTENEAPLTEAETAITIAGRIMSLRGHGATSFGHVEDQTGRLQFYVRRDELGVEPYRLFKLLEVGDIVGIVGTVFRTKTGELTVRARRVDVLAKALRPLPEKWHGLRDKELRYRQRYVDMIMNADVREVFRKRSRLVETMRQFLIGRGYLEVETPVLQPVYGGAAARPFVTHHNALDVDVYLRIADELYLKRLLVGGLERVFEFSKDFRNEGIDRTHYPEFTMMECYSVYEDYMDYMDMVEEMFRALAEELGTNGKISYQGRMVDFAKPWARIRFFDALEKHAGVSLARADEAGVFAAAEKLNVELPEGATLAGALDEIFSERVEPLLLDPTFVYDYPKQLSPLAKDHRSEKGLVERFEPFICGFEVGNAFSELNDPLEQRKRFEEQARFKQRGDENAHVVDEDFIRALEHGMPPAAGLGLGIDRLTMIFTDSASIRDVLFFPQLRPE